MTEVPGSVQTSRHALERSGTLLNAEYVHRWQHADGAYRQRARRLLSGLALWVGAVGALALAFCRASIHSMLSRWTAVAVHEKWRERREGGKEVKEGQGWLLSCLVAWRVDGELPTAYCDGRRTT